MKRRIIGLVCFLASLHLVAAETPVRREIVQRVELAKGLKATITRRQSCRTGIEKVICNFWQGPASSRKTSGPSKTSVLGLIDEDVVATGDFLGNGRQQILVFMCMGGTLGEMYDFDGDRVRTVYSSENYGQRVWLKSRLDHDGRSLIEEDWGNYGEEQPAGSRYRRSDNTFVRLLKWRNGQWVPVKFRFVKHRLLPLD